MPKVRLTTSSTSDSSLAVDSNAMLNIGTLNTTSEIKEGTCVLSSNNCEQWNINQKSDSNLTLCDNINDRDNIKGSTCLTKDALSIDGNPNTLGDSSNNVMSDSSLAANSNATSNVNVENILISILASPFGPSRRSARKIRWTDDEGSIILSSFSTYLHSTDNKTKLPSFREINEIKVKHPVLMAYSNAQIKSWLYQEKKLT
ncbi:uncharacterized protein [Temnothorax longispinosus]|uniref:uncharacterized protein n=1 Tax=Temnothorax longispinosus TaxID=300112 RepID=UPI003A9998A4